MIDSYPYGEVFQMRLLALLVQQPQKVLGIVEPQYFTIGNFVEVSRIALDIYAKYLLKKPDFRLDYESLKEAVYAKETDSHRRHNFKRLLKDIFRMSPDDSPFLIDQARGFAKVCQYRETLVAAEKDVTNGNYDRVHERFDKLRTPLNGTGAEAVRWSLLPHPRDFPFRDIEWTINTILPTDAVIVLSGVEGVGKTLLALSLARAITEGTDFLEYEARPRKVLYNGIDMSRTNLGNYLRMMRWDPDDDFRFISQWTGEGFPPSMLDDPAGVAWLCKYAKKYQPVMIFDTVRDYFSGEENSSTDWKPVADAAREFRSLGATPILLAHPDKSEKHTVRGSHLIAQKADIPYIVHKERWKGRELCVLQCPSKNRVGSTAFTLAMEMQFIPIPNGIPYFRFRERSGWKPGKTSKREGELDSVVAYVEEHPGATQKQIEVALHMGDKKVKELVELGKDDGLLQSQKGRGHTWHWRIVEKAGPVSDDSETAAMVTPRV